MTWRDLNRGLQSQITEHAWRTGPLAILALLVLWFSARWMRPSKGQLPPGPRGLPFFGNLFQLKVNLWEPFTEWSEQYGGIVYINLCGQPVVILNDLKTASDLLEGRSSIYSDRPPNIVGQDIICGGMLLIFGRYDSLWRKMRKAAHEGLTKNASDQFASLTTREAVNLVSGLINDPSCWLENFKRTSASIVLSAIYDIPSLDSVHDPAMTAIDDFATVVANSAVPGAYLVEFFTWMKYLPSSIAPWKRNAEMAFRKYSKLFEGMYETVNTRVLKGDDRPSFCATLTREGDRNKLSKQESAWLAATMYLAGEDTTTRTMAWFLQAMQLYPEVQRKAQKELDEVIGRSQMPTYQDINRLPYINAIVKELLRHRPIVPTNVPHATTKDDFYGGYFIPKGTVVFANIWAMHLDKDTFGADAHVFNPERYLNEGSQSIYTSTKGEGHLTFGFGRRICPGRHIANASLNLEIASILWAANIEPPTDKNGQPIMPDPSFNAQLGLTTQPEPFNCSITLRFPEAERILAQTKEAVSRD